MEEERLKKEFARDVVLLKYVGVNPVIVHGGGPQIEKMLTRLDIPTRFVEGLRATDGETLEIVEMVLSGSINKAIVQAIHNAGGQAIGLSGKDGKLIVAERVKGKDIGFVGDVVGVNGRILKDISDSGYIPVIAPLAAGVDGTTYNVNADTVAGSVAKALMAEKLILLTDVPGVLDAIFEAHLVDEHAGGEKTSEERYGEGGHDPQSHVLSRCAPRRGEEDPHHRWPRSPRPAPRRYSPIWGSVHR